jgi:hypothetical protein
MLMVMTIPAVVRFIEASLFCIARVFPRSFPEANSYCFDDKDTARHRLSRRQLSISGLTGRLGIIRSRPGDESF